MMLNWRCQKGDTEGDRSLLPEEEMTLGGRVLITVCQYLKGGYKDNEIWSMKGAGYVFLSLGLY